MAMMRAEGLDELADLFESLPDEMDDALRSAAQAGASIIKNEVVLRAPRHLGVLADNIYQKHIPELSSATKQTYFVSWRKKDRKKDVPFYGVWVEYGHWYVPPKAEGISWKRHRADNQAIFVPAHPFIRPAYESKKQAALDEMKTVLASSVSEILGRRR